MIRIRGPTDVGRTADPHMRALLRDRLTQLSHSEPYDPDIHGELIVVEPGDTLNSLEEETGLPIATNPFDESRFPDPDFVSVAEALEEHAALYEMTIVLTDDGGAILFIPKHPGIDADLLELCARFAMPAPETTS